VADKPLSLSGTAHWLRNSEPLLAPRNQNALLPTPHTLNLDQHGWEKYRSNAKTVAERIASGLWRLAIYVFPGPRPIRNVGLPFSLPRKLRAAFSLGLLRNRTALNFLRLVFLLPIFLLALSRSVPSLNLSRLLVLGTPYPQICDAFYFIQLFTLPDFCYLCFFLCVCVWGLFSMTPRNKNTSDALYLPTLWGNTLISMNRVSRILGEHALSNKRPTAYRFGYV